MAKFPSEKQLKAAREALESGPASRPFPKDAPPVERTKYSIAQEIVKYMNHHQITQRALAEKLGIDEALVSKLVHYHLEEFTTDRLLKYLNMLYPKVEVKISVA